MICRLKNGESNPADTNAIILVNGANSPLQRITVTVSFLTTLHQNLLHLLPKYLAKVKVQIPERIDCDPETFGDSCIKRCFRNARMSLTAGVFIHIKKIYDFFGILLQWF